MKDFPVFATEYGVSSIVLREIPYREEAYIQIQDTQPDGFEMHLKECVAFCRMAGAERVYASGDPMLENYPFHTAVVEMRGKAWVDPEKVENLFPVTEQTVGKWRSVYNTRLKNVDNASTLQLTDEKRILESGGAYFVHSHGNLLGIGWVEDGTLLAVAAVESGAGERVMHTLMSLYEDSDIILEVASTNAPALRLYDKLGFIPVRERIRWYRVL